MISLLACSVGLSVITMLKVNTPGAMGNSRSDQQCALLTVRGSGNVKRLNEF